VGSELFKFFEMTRLIHRMPLRSNGLRLMRIGCSLRGRTSSSAISKRRLSVSVVAAISNAVSGAKLLMIWPGFCCMKIGRKRRENLTAKTERFNHVSEPEWPTDEHGLLTGADRSNGH